MLALLLAAAEKQIQLVGWVELLRNPSFFSRHEVWCGALDWRWVSQELTPSYALGKSVCHRKGIEPTFREGSPRSCAKM